MMSDGWYGLAAPTETVVQGDLIFNCPLLAWRSGDIQVSGGDIGQTFRQNVQIIENNVIVMTQACDLAQGKVQNVIVCPHYTLEQYRSTWSGTMLAQGQNPTEKAWKKQCEFISDGYVWNLSMLNAGSEEGVDLPIRIVDFHEVFTLPRVFLESLLAQRGQPRPYLLSPYREHLSQAFARYFMRVGLPTSISKTW